MKPYHSIQLAMAIAAAAAARDQELYGALRPRVVTAEERAAKDAKRKERKAERQRRKAARR